MSRSWPINVRAWRATHRASNASYYAAASLCVAMLIGMSQGCGSGEFGPVGNDLPQEVTQDSLSVDAAPIFAAAELTVEPILEQELWQREQLYLGRRLRDASHDRSAWQATPMMRFDFENPEGDVLDPDANTWTSVQLVYFVSKADDVYGSATGFTSDDEIDRTRQVRIQLLTELLDESLLGQPLSGLLGEEIYFDAASQSQTRPVIELLKSSTADVDTTVSFYSTLRAWMAGASHNGLAVVDETPALDAELDHSLIRIAASEFPVSLGVRLDREDDETFFQPNLQIKFKDSEGNEFATQFPASFDMTHFEVEQNLEPRIELGTHITRRSWLQFDLSASDVPTNATINRATLRVVVDREFGFIDNQYFANADASPTTTADSVRYDVPSRERLTTIQVYEALEVEANVQSVSSLRLVSGSGDSIDMNAAEDDTLEFNVTAHIQRVVNGRVDAATGLALQIVGASSVLDLRHLELYTSAAADPENRPQIRIQFTPPADFGGGN